MDEECAALVPEPVDCGLLVTGTWEWACETERSIWA